MKNTIKNTIATFVVSGLAAGTMIAGPTATQTVSYSVAAINELSVSGNPGALLVDSATAGGAPVSDTDASTSYAITTNEVDRKITGSINAEMPNGVTLSVALASAGGESLNSKALGMNPVDLANDISTLNESGNVITYELEATSAAGVVVPSTKTVTFTVTADA
jgi:hypothetical protein